MGAGLRSSRRCAAALLIALVLAGAAASASGAQPSADILAGSRTLFTLSGGIGSISASERAQIVNSRIDRILRDQKLDPRTIAVSALSDGTPVIALGRLRIIEVTARDAESNGLGQQELARQWADALGTSLTQLQPLYAQRGTANVKTLNEHRVLLLILQVAILLLAARALGEAALRIGQPPVIGQLLAGILLGHSVLGALWPQAKSFVFPVETTQAYLLEVVSWIGVLFLLLLTGLETDVALIRQQGRPVLFVSATGVMLPFLLGAGLGFAVPGFLLTAPDSRPVLALFLGTVLSVSSVPVIAKILLDMRLLRRNVGQSILAAALLHDTIGWLLLGVVASFAAGDGVDVGVVARTVLGTAAFLLFAATLGRTLTRRLLRWANDRLQTEDVLLTAVIVLMLLAAAVTQLIGVHAILGAFVMGILIRQSPVVTERVLRPLDSVTGAIFAPIFFAAAGLHVNLATLAVPRLVAMAALLIGAACVGKVAGCYVGARWAGVARWEALSIGIGTNARGAMGLIVGVLGFSLGILTVDMFSLIILMAIVTTAITPPLLRWSLARVQPAGEEEERLRKEALRAGSFIGRLQRVLLPTRGGPDADLAGTLVTAIAQNQPLEVTAMYVQNTGGPEQASEALGGLRQTLEAPEVSFHGMSVPQGEPAEAILEESGRGYDLLALGCGPASPDRGAVFGDVVDAIARSARLPLLIVRAPHAKTTRMAEILLPTATALHSVQAAELAVSVARASGARLTAMHVFEKLDEALFWLGDYERSAEEAGADLLEQVRSLGEAHGVTVQTLLVRSDHAAREIVRIANERATDLVVMGGSVRPTRSLFLGSSIRPIQRGVGCAVAVLRA